METKGISAVAAQVGNATVILRWQGRQPNREQPYLHRVGPQLFVCVSCPCRQSSTNNHPFLFPNPYFLANPIFHCRSARRWTCGVTKHDL